MKTILTCLIGCFICMGAFADDTESEEYSSAELGLTTDEEVCIKSAVACARKNPAFAMELVPRIRDAVQTTNQLKASNDLSEADKNWVQKHADYWGHKRGYDRTHKHAAVAMLKKAELSENLSTSVNDDKQWDFDAFWWWMPIYGGNKWEPMKSEIKAAFDRAWDRGYNET